MIEGIATNKALSKAKTERAAAHRPAHEKYIGFKRVVRNALGANSKQYKRIHMRASPGTRSKGDEGAASDKGAAGSGKASAPAVDVKSPAPAVDIKAPVPTVDSKGAPPGDTKASNVPPPAVGDIVASFAEASAPAAAAPESLSAP